jgi:hypothetical protein
MLLARLTLEILAPVPLAPLRVDAQIVKPGRRFQLAEAAISVDGRDACRARGALLRHAGAGVAAVAPPARELPGPEESVAPRPPGDRDGFGWTAMQLRFADGDWGRGPGAAWFRFAMPLVAGEEPSPVQRVAAAADFGNGISSELDWDDFLFVNTDLTIHLQRPPRGEWILLDSQTAIDPGGTGLATSALRDEHGPIGASLQTLYVAPR